MRSLARIVQTPFRRAYATTSHRFLQRQLLHEARSLSSTAAEPAYPATSDQDALEKIEEETIPYYSPEYYYPVRFGETLHMRYKVISKLGYGSNSTVWFCQDLKREWKKHYVVVKVGTRDSSQADREVEISDYLATVKSNCIGSQLIRPVLDHFDIQGSSGPHPCLVHPVLGAPVDVFQDLLPDRELSEAALKTIIGFTLHAFDFLHSEADIVYTDLKADNIIFGIRDTSIFEDYVAFVQENSAPDKIDGDRFIYRSRELNALSQMGSPMLCDFGQARLKEHPHTGVIMPYQYRAPEVLLGLTWDNKIDIWSIAMLAWHLVFKSPMFVPVDQDRHPSVSVHLAQMVALIGPPPLELLQRSGCSSEYFTRDGKLLANHDLPVRSFETYGESLESGNKKLFFDFIRRIVRWLPEERPSAKELLADPWLQIA